MSRTITWFVGIGVLPLGLAWAVYLMARELLSWPLFGARLWGVAVALLLVGIGNELCKRFLAAGDRNRQPHEVGRFLARLTSLHGLAALAAAAAYLLTAWFWADRHSCNQWPCYASAVLAGLLGYGIFLWIFFPETDSYRAGRVMLRRGRARPGGKQR